MKVGLELYLRHGPAVVAAVRAAADRAVFLDLKLHDIPHTVAGAARSLSALAPDYLTVHAAGGAEMIRAAVEVLPDTRVAAVTLLTSLSEDDVSAIGFGGSPRYVVRQLAALAVAAGARAIVCSPAEVADVRREVGQDVVLVTPGVRFAGSAFGDQARVATPQQALDAGADLLVVGRPITAAADIATAARRVAEELDSV
jgi:orotidine-5'-phosphate decarboxylase